MSYLSTPLPKRPRVLFMGTPEFAVPALDALIEWGAEVVAVVSQPDRPKGRGKRLQRTPVAARADQHELTVFQWSRLSNESYQTLSTLNFDLAVVIAYGKILPKRYLELAPWGCVNLHGSLLPKYRGAAPIQWALINGETETGITVMRLDEGMDTGDVAYMKRTAILSHETTGDLYQRLSHLAAEALSEALQMWVRGVLHFVPQDHEGASHAPMLNKQTGALDWSSSAQRLSNLIRGVHPWPGAFITLQEEVLKVHRAEVVSSAHILHLKEQAGILSHSPGVIISLSGGGPVILCGEGALRLTSVQRPSRTAITGADFCRSYSMTVGEPLV